MDLESAGKYAGSTIIGAILGALGIKWKLAEYETKLKDLEKKNDDRLDEFRKEVAATFSKFEDRTTKAIDEIKAAASRMSDRVVWQDACDNCKKLSKSQNESHVRTIESMDRKLDLLIEKVK